MRFISSCRRRLNRASQRDLFAGSSLRVRFSGKVRGTPFNTRLETRRSSNGNTISTGFGEAMVASS